MLKLMTAPPYSLYAFGKNLGLVHTYLKEAYIEKKRTFADGFSSFKDEFSGQTSKCIDHVSLPINNFLKDIVEIENEFKEELNKSQEYCICLDGKMVPANEVLLYSMEENY